MNIPLEIKTRFDALLVKKQIPAQRHNYYRKWLRYYLDFCRKYHHSALKEESPPHFIKKLQDKNKTQEQRKQASHAISLYQTLIQSKPERQEKIPDPPPTYREAMLQAFSGGLKHYFIKKRTGMDQNAVSYLMNLPGITDSTDTCPAISIFP